MTSVGGMRADETSVAKGDAWVSARVAERFQWGEIEENETSERTPNEGECEGVGTAWWIETSPDEGAETLFSTNTCFALIERRRRKH